MKILVVAKQNKCEFEWSRVIGIAVLLILWWFEFWIRRAEDSKNTVMTIPPGNWNIPYVRHAVFRLQQHYNVVASETLF